MKKTFIVMGMAVLLYSCDAPKADKAEATEAQAVEQPATGATYNADATQSKVEWVGSKPTGKHHGTIAIKSGSLMVEGGNITGGKFVMDMTSITPDDQDAEGNGKLGGHLKSPDFFDATAHPEATFEVTQVSAGVDSAKNLVMKDATHTITGNLTMKAVSKSISFPAKVSVTDAQIVGDAEFNIDRTQWGISYGNDKSLGNKMINSDINVKLHLVANK